MCTGRGGYGKTGKSRIGSSLFWQSGYTFFLFGCYYRFCPPLRCLSSNISVTSCFWPLPYFSWYWPRYTFHSLSVIQAHIPFKTKRPGQDLMMACRAHPFVSTEKARRIDYESVNLFKNYLKANREDYVNLLAGKPVSQKLLWLPLTDRKLPNFRLFFEFLNHISEENLEGYYGENLVHLCKYIALNFRSRDEEWTVKQLQKAHSGWKTCNPKRRMDLKIDIQNHLVSPGGP